MTFGDERLPPRFWSKVRENPTTGCWEWVACTNKAGYGRIGVGRSTVLAHRLSYEALVAPIRDGLQIDHVCRVRCCCNPGHLEPVTGRENVLRGSAAAIRYCYRGHPATRENIGPNGDGKRKCRLCATIAMRGVLERRRSKKAKRAA